MAITVRQGNKDDFDPESLQSGEWACVVDAKEAHLCFGDGVTRKMATYEEIEVLANSAIASASTASTKASEASTSASTATTKASEASESALSASTSAQTASTKASEATASANTATTKASEASTSATNALTSETNASASASSASASAQTATTKASEASTSAQTATTKASEASASATSASNSASLIDGVITEATAQATTSQSWATGGTGTRTGEDTDNAHYWCQQAQNIAGGGVTSVNGKTGTVELVPSDISLGNVPNVSTNDQTPTYTEASTLETLTSGEKLSLSLGKAKKAISDLITHLADTVKHITSEERTAWNAKASTVNITQSGTSISLNDAKNASLQSIKLYGKSTQSGTPSVSTPIPIVDVVNPKIIVNRKNFLQNTATTLTKNGITFTVNADGSVTANGTATAKATVLLSPDDKTLRNQLLNKEVTLSGNTINSNLNLQLWNCDGSGTLKVDNGNGITFTFTNASETYNVAITIHSGETVNVTIYPMIRLASITDATYEPYTEQTVTVSGTYRSVGDVKDVIDSVSGKITRKLGIAVFDGSDDELWENGERGDKKTYRRFILKKADKKNKCVLLCSHFQYVETSAYVYNGEAICKEDTGATRIDIVSTQLDLASWKTWLANNPITVIYELATPIETDISYETLTALRALTTYYPITNISNDNSCDMDIAYQLGVATNDSIGFVKPDNITTTVDANGVITATAQAPDIATPLVAGTVKPDGTTITVDANGVITATAQAPDIATPLVAGIVKFDDETIGMDENDALYVIGGGDASGVAYSNTESGLTATNVQDAIDEVNRNLANGQVKFKVENGELYYSVNS